MIGNGAAIAGMLVLTAALALAQPPATQPAATQPATQPAAVDADRIAALIGQLGAPKFADRQQAQRALVQLGAPAEPALRVASTKSANAEIRRRAAAAIDRIEAGFPDAPSYVVVRADKENPGKVLSAMADQAGIMISPHAAEFATSGGINSKPITLDLGRVPLLVALEKFCQATQACPNSNSGGTDDAFSLNGGPTGPWDQEDRVAVVADQIVQTRQIQFGSNANTHTDTLSLTFLVDPKRPLVDHQMPRLTQIVDENGVSFLAPVSGQDNNMGNALQKPCSFDADLPLQIPPTRGKTLAHVKGKIVLRVATKTQTIFIPDIGKALHAPAISACDRKVEVVSFSFNGAVGNINFRVSNTMPQNALTALESKGQAFDLGTEFRTCQITDANGNALAFDSNGWDSTDRVLNWQGHFTANNSPGPLKPPFSLRWRIVAASEDITVPFEFRNLPLPSP
jgi:hypothetical protein